MRGSLCAAAFVAAVGFVPGSSAGGQAAPPSDASSGAAVAAPAKAAKRDETFEAFDLRIMAELRALDPVAAALFEEANAARKGNDHAKAAALYARVYAQVPSFVHALRRQCGEEVALGHREDAIAHCRAAVVQDASAENEGTFSYALLSPPGGMRTPDWKPSAEEIDMAAHAVDAGIAADANGPFIWMASCNLSLVAQDLARLRACVDALQRLAPEASGTHVYASILATSEERWADAERELDRARELGLSEEEYRNLREQERSVQPLTHRILPTAALVAGIWLAGLLLLLGAAWILSRITLRAVSRAPVEGEEAGGEVKGIAGSIRSVYRVVLWLSCAYYYASLPVVFVGVLVLGGGLLYGIIAIGHVPVKLLVIVAIVTLGTLWAIVRSLFVRGRDEDPGLKLELRDHPRLAKLLEEVALAVGTRPVDSVYLTPGTIIAVMERGKMLRQLAAGRRERCLILGAGVLEGMRLGPLKAVLAHEYGHLTNRDTAGGGFALAVRRSLHAMAQSLASAGAATWYNPAWLFLNGFYRVFLRISQGASRLQEVLADRWAASIYGAAAFEEGLRHVVAKSIRFNASVGAVLEEVMKKKIALWNVYEYKPEEQLDEEAMEEAVRQAIERPASPYDSHPSPTDRFRWIGALPSRGSASTFDDAREAWSLFEDRDFIERRMTAELRELILLQNGIELLPGQAAGWTPPGSQPESAQRT